MSYISYICECGKSFDNPQKFNAHKRHCLLHAEACGKVEKFRIADTTAARKASAAASSKRNQKKREIQDLWISEKHCCEKCGKVMTKKYGTGRFCSQSCANSHANSGPKPNSIKHNFINVEERKLKYNENPKLCSVCGNKIPYEIRNRTTCSDRCCSIKRSHKCEHKKEYKGKNVTGRHIVYKIINDFDSRYYIGVRKTENDNTDPYLGSGIHITNMVKHYGRQHFCRITLFEFDNSADAYNKEKELIGKHWGDPNMLNLAKGGQGGCTFGGKKHSEYTRQILREKALAAHARKKLNQSGS